MWIASQIKLFHMILRQQKQRQEMFYAKWGLTFWENLQKQTNK